MATPTKPRRQTVSTLPPPNPLGLPEPVFGAGGRDMRPPSPLRHEVGLEEDSDEEEEYDGRAPTFAGYAANFARSVGSLMSPAKSMQSLPSDAELEAEAERERDRSRREAEWILMREAEDRRRAEERVLAMIHDPKADEALQPPPSRSQSNSNPPSPSNSQKDPGWWSTAKAKLTPTKEALTPAQQVIHETKSRNKAQKKADKAAEKAERKVRDNQWPSKASGKFTDPAFIALASSPGGQEIAPAPFNNPNLSAPVTPPGPPRRQFSTPASLTASPAQGANGSQPPLMYAQWTEEGALNLEDTLLVIAKRFEKLEKWTVGHVRALEERMSDVERWLVDKEHEREEVAANKGVETDGDVLIVVDGMREEMMELQGRIGELGREMAKLASAPSVPRGASETPPPPPPPPPPPLTRNGSTPSSAFSVQKIPPYVNRTPSTTRTASQATSPPPTTPGPTTSRTRLPYPTGDYASPPAANLTDRITPVDSPPPSAISPAITGLPRPESPTPLASNSSHGLPLPNAPALRSQRAGSVSPTPRKRYTVALGASITGQPDENEQQPQQQSRSRSHSRSSSRIETAFFVDSPAMTDAEEDDELGGETIGKSASRRLVGKQPPEETPATLTRSEFRDKRAQRAQSAYGYASVVANSSGNESDTSSTAPLRVRSRSSERLRASTSLNSIGLGLAAPNPDGGRFVDPLLVRREERERERSAAPAAPKVMAGRKVPINQLVAFFDGSNERR